MNREITRGHGLDVIETYPPTCKIMDHDTYKRREQH